MAPPREDKTHPAPVAFLSRGSINRCEVYSRLPSESNTRITRLVIPANALILGSGAHQDALAHSKDVDSHIPHAEASQGGVREAEVVSPGE